jgi:hypothetical protein
MSRVRPRFGAGIAALAFLCAVVLAAFAIPSADGAESRPAKLLGKTSRNPAPSCKHPPGDCFAVGKVTGFMTRVNGQKRPMVAPKNGSIVAWAIQLGRKPSRKQPKPVSQWEFFSNLWGSERFGNGPTARISILRRVKRGKDKGKMKLIRQSPLVRLNNLFRQRTYITLERPLKIRKGDIVALTTDTWLVNLVSAAARPNRAGDSAWRASRTNCTPNGARNSKAHRKVGTTRRYGCQFSDRLLYWASFVPNRNA